MHVIFAVLKDKQQSVLSHNSSRLPLKSRVVHEKSSVQRSDYHPVCCFENDGSRVQVGTSSGSKGSTAIVG